MYIGIGVGHSVKNASTGGSASQLVSVPSFNSSTGRLDAGSWYNTRSTVTTFIDHEGVVREMPKETLVYEGARRTRNLFTDPTTTLASGSSTTAVTVESGNYVFSMGAGSGTATFSGTATGSSGTLNADASNRTAKALTITAAGTIIVTASVADLATIQLEKLTGATDPAIPSEYEPVGTPIGDNLVTNGTFDTDSDWTKNGTWAIASGTASINNVSGFNQSLTQVLAGKNGTSYIVSIETTAKSGTGAFLYWGNANLGSISSVGTHTFLVTLALGTNQFFITAYNGTNITIDNVSVHRAATGIGIYNRTNGNTVLSNVVTESPGTLLATPPWLRYEPAATNYFQNSAAPVTQTVSGIPAGSVTVWMKGTGSVVLSGDATGTVTEGSPVTYTGTGANLTCTVTNADMVQVENRGYPTSFITTAGAAVTRTIDGIKHPYSASVFDVDEGSLYMEVEFPVDTANFADSAYSLFQLSEVYGGNRRVAYVEAAMPNSMALKDSGGDLIVSSFSNITADTVIRIRASWSVSMDTAFLGVNENYSAGDFDGFTPETVIALMLQCYLPAKIHVCKVHGTYLTTAEHEARWP